MEQQILANLEDILSYCRATFTKNEKLISSNCIIHGGDNETALNIYYNGDYKNHWICRTHHCEKIFTNSIVGLIRGVVSSVNGWEQKGDKLATNNEIEDFLKNWSKRKNIPAGPKKRTDKSYRPRFFPKTIMDNFIFPPTYYLRRGFCENILKKFNIRYCLSMESPFFNRAILPIFDETSQYIVGLSGRITFDKCKKCRCYHNPVGKCTKIPKWRHSKGFRSDQHLYNIWNARHHFNGTAILCESPNDVLKLEQAGIYNSVACFGTHLSNAQILLLNKYGVLNITVPEHSDGAGREFSSFLKSRLSNLFRINIFPLTKSDIAEYSEKEIKELL